MKSSHNGRMRLQAPPLLVWIIAAAVFSVFFLLTIKAFIKYQQKPFTDSALKRLEKFAVTGNSGNKGLRVIALGSSLTRMGFLYDGKMEALARKNGLNGLKFLRLTLFKCDFSDYEPIFDKILDAKPDVLLIESDTMFYIRPDKNFFKEYSDFLRYVFLKSMDAKKLVTPKVGTYNPDAAVDPPLPKEEPADLQKAADAARDRSFTDLNSIAPMLRKAAEGGTRIVLVQMRREAGFERLAGIKRSETEVIYQRLPAEYGASLIGYPDEIGTEYFRDHGHLNEKGRLKLSLWLIEALKKMGRKA